MKYFIEPSTSIFVISARLIQVSNYLNSITFEDENANFTKILSLIHAYNNNDFESSMSGDEFENTIGPLLAVLVEHGFVLEKTRDYSDLAQLHLALIKQNSAELPFAEQIFTTTQCTVTVIGEGVFARRIISELCTLGYEALHHMPGDDLPNHPIICCADAEAPFLFEQVNQQATERGICCLFVTLSHSLLKVGPFFIPEQTACYRCLIHRSLPSTSFIDEYLGKKTDQACLHRATGHANLYALPATYFVVSQILRLFQGNFHLCLFNEVLELDLIDYRQTIRPVMKIAHCDHCNKRHTEKATRLLRHQI